MINDLLACLEIYKQYILSGNFNKENEDSAKKALFEINALEELLNSNQSLNDFSFTSLKRDINTVFNPEHFKEENSQETLNKFNETIDRIKKEIKEGIDITFKKDEEVAPKKTYEYRKETYAMSSDPVASTVSAYLVDSFYSLFVRKPSGILDYVHLVDKMTSKLDKIIEKLNELDLNIDILKRKVDYNDEKRTEATSEEAINRAYDELCIRLEEIAGSLKVKQEQKKNELNERFNELGPVITSKCNEWSFRYDDLIEEKNKLVEEYQQTTSAGNAKKAKIILKKLDEINAKIEKKNQVLDYGLQEYITALVIKKDRKYQDIQKKHDNLINASNLVEHRYNYVLDNKEETKVQITESIKKPYLDERKKTTNELERLQAKRCRLERLFNKLNAKYEDFLEEYHNLAPCKKIEKKH